MTPAEVSAQLRSQGTFSADYARRRVVVGLSFAGIAALGLVALYQTGVLGSGLV